MLQLSSLSEGGFRKPILAKQNKIRLYIIIIYNTCIIVYCSYTDKS